jgi:hypothetical protein
MIEGEHMKRLFLVGMIAVVILFLSLSLTCAGGNPPPEVLQAANDGVRLFLSDPKAKSLDRMGFNGAPDIEQAELGDAFQVFSLIPDRLLNNMSSNDFEGLTDPLKQWQFLVRSGDAPKALLTVEQVDNSWIPVSIGAAGLAKELARLATLWPISKGYTYKFIRIYQVKSELIELRKDNIVIGIVPLNSFRVATGDTPEKFGLLEPQNPAGIIQQLRSSIKDVMEAEDYPLPFDKNR